ncbi:NAD(P)-binding domain-containing protein [Bradyrhizobium elkanii]|uniref:NAD(P)-binding domain-containing protein n=1 Tax=Bradyrhizobium elkanii TaxID=29448 RepID=UPI00351904E8
MKIGFIGAGRIAQVLAKKMVAGGCTVRARQSDRYDRAGFQACAAGHHHHR